MLTQLVSLERLTSTQHKYSKTYSDFVLDTKMEFPRVIYLKDSYLKAVKNLRLKEIFEKQFRTAENAYFKHFLVIIS